MAADCKKLNVSFHLLEGSGAEALPQWVEDHNIGAVVCDFNPLRTPLGWLDGVKKKLKKDVPLIQVYLHSMLSIYCSFAAILMQLHTSCNFTRDVIFISDL